MKKSIATLSVVTILTAGCAPMQTTSQPQATIAKPTLQTYDNRIILNDPKMPFAKVAFLAMKKMGIEVQSLDEFKKYAKSKDIPTRSGFPATLNVFVVGDTLYAAIKDMYGSNNEWNRNTGNFKLEYNKINHMFYAAAREVVSDSSSLKAMDELITDLDYISLITKNMTEAGAAEWVKENLRGKVIRWNLPLITCTRKSADYFTSSAPQKSFLASFTTDNDEISNGVTILFETNKSEYLKIPSYAMVKDSGTVLRGSKFALGFSLTVTDDIKK